MSILFLTHLCVTLFLLGLIWVVQIVQYPLFKEIASDSFAAYESSYQTRITYLVMPTMVCELGTAILILTLNTPEMSRLVQVSNLVLIACTWASTALLQVPCHRRLLEGFDPVVHRRLVLSNWVRTLLWTVRSAMLIIVLTAERFAILAFTAG